MKVKHGTIVVVASAVLWLVGARFVSADASKRAQLKDEISRLLGRIAGELRDVPTDSGTSDLDYAIGYAGEIYDKARALKDVAGDDSEAQAMAYYADVARSFQDAARYLRELKVDQRKLDDHPRKCEEKQRELAGRLRAFTDTHDPRGLEEVPKLAREYGTFGKETLDAAEGARRLAQDRYGRVTYFSGGDSKWSDVRSYFYAAGKALYEHTERLNEQLKRNELCGDLAKGDRNPHIEQAMQKLSEGKRGIEGLYTALDAQLAELGSYVDRVASDSSDSYVAYSERKLDEIDKMLEQLDRAKGNDSEARRRVDTWRNISRAARDAMKPWRELKQAQYLADNAPTRCREATAALRDVLRKYVDRLDTEGLTVIPLRARGFAEPVKAGLDKTDAQHSIMERAYSDAQRFDASEGRWRDVRDRYRYSATAIIEYWRKARDLAHRECDELAKGEQSSEVQAALKTLGASRTSGETQLAQLRADHARWNDGIKELRSWYKEDTTNVRNMFCAVEESPGDTDLGDAYSAQLAQIADRMRARIAPKWRSIFDEAARLDRVAKLLKQQNDQAVRTSAEAILAQIGKRMNALSNVLDKELNGANDPEVRAMIETGKNEHKRIQADSSKCQVAEVSIPGYSMRMDCVRSYAGTCYIVEIKPNNSAAIAKGRSRLAEYARAMKSYFDSNKSDIDAGFRDKLAIFKNCIKDGQISVDVELRAYEYCPADDMLFSDNLVE